MAARFLASPWTRSSAACRALVPAESVCLIPAAASDWLSAALHRPPCCTGLQLLVARLETTRDPQRPARYSWHLGTRPPGLWAEISACCLTWATVFGICADHERPDETSKRSLCGQREAPCVSPAGCSPAVSDTRNVD